MAVDVGNEHAGPSARSGRGAATFCRAIHIAIPLKVKLMVDMAPLATPSLTAGSPVTLVELSMLIVAEVVVAPFDVEAEA